MRKLSRKGDVTCTNNRVLLYFATCVSLTIAISLYSGRNVRLTGARNDRHQRRQELAYQPSMSCTPGRTPYTACTLSESWPVLYGVGDDYGLGKEAEKRFHSSFSAGMNTKKNSRGFFITNGKNGTFSPPSTEGRKE